MRRVLTASLALFLTFPAASPTRAAPPTIPAAPATAAAAAGSGPTPPPTSLPAAIHRALTAPDVPGISAQVTFTNNLIDSSDFAGHAVDPLLQGASGRLWLSNDGRLRLELQSDNGDTQIVVGKSSFWVSDPAQHTVYEGTLPPRQSDTGGQSSDKIPSEADIQSALGRLMQRFDVSGAVPTDVAGQAAYRVSISPRHDGGLLGSAQMAWDAARGVPLQVGVYARGNPTPVLEIKATGISYGAVPDSDLNVAPPSGSKIVRLPAMSASHERGAHAKATHVTGRRAVAARLPFTLTAPATLVGLPRHEISLLDWGGTPGAVVSYGANLGGIVVLERRASAGESSTAPSSVDGLSLPTVAIGDAKGQELSTALGTVVHFTRDGVDYTVLGSVPAVAAEAAARAL